MEPYQDVFKRYEKKYLLTSQQRSAISKVLAPRMARDRFAESTIGNIYYDTPDCRLVRRSLDHPEYKEKLRLRTYKTPDADTPAFVEIKKKYDHIVYKRRVEMGYKDALEYLDGAPAPEDTQIAREIEWFRKSYEGLRPAMCIFYDRLAVFDPAQPALRITFDTGIRWRVDALDLSMGTYGEQLLPPGESLMEIKIPGAVPVWLAHALSEAGIFPIHYSKYGLAYKTHLERMREAGNETEDERGVFCA